MTDYATFPTICDSVHALLALLNDEEKASLAGSIFNKCGLDGNAYETFCNELDDAHLETVDTTGR